MNQTLKCRYGVDLDGNTALWYGVTHATESRLVLTPADKHKREEQAAARLIQFWRKHRRGNGGGMALVLERALRSQAASALQAGDNSDGDGRVRVNQDHVAQDHVTQDHMVQDYVAQNVVPQAQDLVAGAEDLAAK